MSFQLQRGLLASEGLNVACANRRGWGALHSDCDRCRACRRLRCPAGGIADEPCPNARGEHTNTCPSGTVGAPYSLRFVESEGSGCGPGRQTFHLDSGLLPPGLVLTPDGTVNGIALETGSFEFYVEMREPQDDPSRCAGKRTQKQFTLRIRAQPWITSTPAIPLGPEVGIPFRLSLRARGGTGIFHWEARAGRLPVGLRLRDDGSIAGTPRVAGTYRFVARARDTESRSIEYPVTLDVAPGYCSGSAIAGGETGSLLQRQLDDRRGCWSDRWKLVAWPPPTGIRLGASTGPHYRHSQPSSARTSSRSKPATDSTRRPLEPSPSWSQLRPRSNPHHLEDERKPGPIGSGRARQKPALLPELRYLPVALVLDGEALDGAGSSPDQEGIGSTQPRGGCLGRSPEFATFQSIYTAFTTGDMDTLATFFEEDVVWHTPGHIPSPARTTGEPRHSRHSQRSSSDRAAATASKFVMCCERRAHRCSPHATADREGKRLDQDYAIVSDARREGAGRLGGLEGPGFAG